MSCLDVFNCKCLLAYPLDVKQALGKVNPGLEQFMRKEPGGCEMLEPSGERLLKKGELPFAMLLRGRMKTHAEVTWVWEQEGADEWQGCVSWEQ